MFLHSIDRVLLQGVVLKARSGAGGVVFCHLGTFTFPLIFSILCRSNFL